MQFTKMQGAGNDYVLIESNGATRDWSKLAITALNRHFGVGGDSLLVLAPSTRADFQMRIFDADGSEAEACGNGTRCLARYVFEKGMIQRGAEYLTIETLSGVRRVRLLQRGGKLVGIQACMGKPIFNAREIPVAGLEKSKIINTQSLVSYPVTVDGTEMVLSLVSMGNPHAVFFQKNPVADFPLSRLGPKVENLKIFPNRINFEVVRVLNRQQAEARVWERGVGETLACGSGACAIIVVGQLSGSLDNKVDVKLPGGILGVEWDGKGEVLLSGPAEIIFTGEWSNKE